MRSLRPILPNGQELPDFPEAVAVGIVIRPDSSSHQMSVVARLPDGTEYSLDELPEDLGSLNQSHFPASPSALREDVLITEYGFKPRWLPVCNLVFFSSDNEAANRYSRQFPLRMSRILPLKEQVLLPTFLRGLPERRQTLSTSAA